MKCSICYGKKVIYQAIDLITQQKFVSVLNDPPYSYRRPSCAMRRARVGVCDDNHTLDTACRLDKVS